MLSIALFFLLAGEPASLGSKPMAPPIHVQVTNPHGIEAPISLLSRRAFRFSYKDLAEAKLDGRGRKREAEADRHPLRRDQRSDQT